MILFLLFCTVLKVPLVVNCIESLILTEKGLHEALGIKSSAVLPFTRKRMGNLRGLSLDKLASLIWVIHPTNRYPWFSPLPTLLGGKYPDGSFWCTQWAEMSVHTSLGWGRWGKITWSRFCTADGREDQIDPRTIWGPLKAYAQVLPTVTENGGDFLGRSRTLEGISYERCFGICGKLSPQSIGPFEMSEIIEVFAYRHTLPTSLEQKRARAEKPSNSSQWQNHNEWEGTQGGNEADISEPF